MINHFYFNYYLTSNICFIKISLENRFKLDKGNDCILTVDGVHCLINEPRPFVTSLSKVWYTKKHNTAGLAYEVAVSILGGDICWVNGPFPAGSYNDWKIFNEFGLKSNLEPGERVETDDGYLGGASIERAVKAQLTIIGVSWFLSFMGLSATKQKYVQMSNAAHD